MSETMTNDNPSRFSHYVTDDYYEQLVADFADWQRDDRLIGDLTERDRFRQLLEREARYLDRLDYDNWLALFDPECAYWVPATANGGDPRHEIAVTFDDRRRLEDRVFRLRTGFAWSQAPSSRTTRQVSNVEVFAGATPDQRMLRANFAIHEFWDGGLRVLSGWSGYRLNQVDDVWVISAKQVNLLICDQCIRNPSIIL